MLIHLDCHHQYLVKYCESSAGWISRERVRWESNFVSGLNLIGSTRIRSFLSIKDQKRRTQKVRSTSHLKLKDLTPCNHECFFSVLEKELATYCIAVHTKSLSHRAFHTGGGGVPIWWRCQSLRIGDPFSDPQLQLNICPFGYYDLHWGVSGLL